MVHIETQKVKVLRSNQKNAKYSMALLSGEGCRVLLIGSGCTALPRLVTFRVQGLGVSGARRV